MRPEVAAIAIATEFDVDVRRPVILGDSNNIVIWLAPSRVVAKVGVGHHALLDRELRVALHLVRVGAPVVRPAGEVPQGVHRYGGFTISFWEYHAQIPGVVLPPDAVAAALHSLHQGLDTLNKPLPSYEHEVAAARDALVDRAAAPTLAPVGREALRFVLDTLPAVVNELCPHHRGLHGSPHDANVLAVRGTPRFIDFETACRGPVEWDLAHTSADIVAAYPTEVDNATLSLCRALVSAKTAAWCWLKAHERDDLRWHAEHHLQLVREFLRSE
jgi:hypothetical protein